MSVPKPIATGLPGLDAFFAAAVPYARGEISPEAFVNEVGPSASGTRRLALYPAIVKNDNRSMLNQMYRPVQRATAYFRLGLWERWLDEFQATHPAHDWRARLLSAGLFEFVKAKREADPHQPLYLEELADLCWIRSAAMVAPAPATDHDAIDASIFVRHYTHAVTAYHAAASDDADAPLPEAKTTLVIVYRSLHTLRPRFFHPNLPALLALARRTDTAPELQAQFTQFTPEMVQRGEDALVEHGVLAPRA